MSLTESLPTTRPTVRPTPICKRKSTSSPGPKGISPVSTWIKPTVRKIAIGSLAPLSISSVAPSRLRRCTPAERKSEKTAAASVEPTMLPSRSPSSSVRSSTYIATTPVTAEVTKTPKVASAAEGFQASFRFSSGVRSPPSKRMNASATVPMACASA